MPPAALSSRTRLWWDHPAYLALLVAAMAVPLLWPPVPPLADLPGHMGRYAIQLGGSAPLGRYYAVHWALIGNLGVDLLMIPLGHLLGIEPAVKLIVLLIPPLTATGFLLVARELHGKAPPTAAFALPLILGYPFQFGFINHALSIALAFLAFALWLRLGRQARFRLRAPLFVCLSMVVWIAHTVGWAVLAICCYAAELVRQRDAGRSWTMAPLRAAVACLPLAPPIAAMLLWRSGGIAGETIGFFDIRAKYGWLQSVLRDRWTRLDGDGAMLLLALIGLGFVRLLRFQRTLFVAATLLAVAYLLLPRRLAGSDYADMRLAPVLVAVAVLALAPRRGGPRWVAPALATAALAFFGVRIAANTASLYAYSQGYAAQLQAVPHIPRGARLFVAVAPPCPRGWEGPRLDHIGSLAIIRREAFVNDQWTVRGAQLVSVRLDLPQGYASDPSQVIRVPGCDRREPLLADVLRGLPRDRFDMLWLINVRPGDRPRDPGFVPVWASDAGAIR